MSIFNQEVLDSLILLILAHFVCDFVLQSDRMAKEKVPGSDVTLSWRWWLTAHASTHGLAVAMITGFPIFGVAEAFAHAGIDWLKGRFQFALALDQSMHVACKIIWIVLIYGLQKNPL